MIAEGTDEGIGEGGEEGYGLRWPGKAAAARLAETPSACALTPLAGEMDATEAPHLFIEGDNLEALKLLLPDYARHVQFIYIDPPYNTGNDFIFADSYRVSRARAGRRAPPTGAITTATTTPTTEASGRRHARWLSMLYPRLLLARQLLSADGALCLSIGEEEVHHARLLLNEVFGEEHHRNTLAIRRYDKNLSRQFMGRGLPSLAVGFEYALIYARGPAFTMNPVFREPRPNRRARGYWKGFWNSADRPTMRYPLLGATPTAGQWKWQESVARAAVEAYRVYQENHAEALTLEEYWEATGRRLRFIRRTPTGRGRNQGVEHWIPPSGGILRSSNWTDVLASESLEPLGLPFDNPKSRELIELLVRLCAREESLILDFFAGSGTTGHAVLALNARDGGRRRFILAQRAEATDDPRFPTIADIARERLRRTLEALAPSAELTRPAIRLLRVMPLEGAAPASPHDATE